MTPPTPRDVERATELWARLQRLARGEERGPRLDGDWAIHRIITLISHVRAEADAAGVERERERCAVVADEYAARTYGTVGETMSRAIAAAIRKSTR